MVHNKDHCQALRNVWIGLMIPISLLCGSQQRPLSGTTQCVDWSDDSYFMFNLCKTNKLILNFRKQSKGPEKTTIHDQEVENVTKYKYLGTVFDNKVRWDDNTGIIVKKCQQRLHFRRKLNSFSVDKTILNMFYFVFHLSAGISIRMLRTGTGPAYRRLYVSAPT